MNKAGNIEIERKLEILKLFLDKADFRKLRSGLEKQLIKEKSIRFMVYIKDQTLMYEIQINYTGKSHNRRG